MEYESSPEFQYIKNFLRKFGIWTERPTKKFLFYRYAGFMVLIIIQMIFGLLGFINESRTGSLTVVCSSLVVFLLGTYASCAMMVLNNGRFDSWITGMFRNEAYMYSHPNEKIRNIHRRNIKIIWPYLLLKVTGFSILVAITVFSIVIFHHIFTHRNHREECERNEKCRMLYMGYYYFPGDSEEHYWLSNMENIVFAIVNCFLNRGKDITFTCFICYLRCKFMMLSEVVKNLDDFFRCTKGDSEYEREVEDLIRECAQEHQEILLEFQQLKEIISILFFFMVVSHAPILVNTALILWQGESLTPFAICIYCGTVYGCGHLFLIFWLSEYLSLESVQLAESINYSNWYLLNVKQQKMLLLMLIRAQNPVVLSCGALCYANLSTFVKTMKTIYTMVNAIASMAK